jgi:hypothetical protein
MAGSMLVIGLGYLLTLLSPSLVFAAIAMLVVGLATGPFDIVLFTLRQRRTDPAWLGRAFAVSMSLNFVGFPVGSALGGAVVPLSIELALGLAVTLNVVAAMVTFVAVPEQA